MTTVAQVVNYSISLANRGARVDVDGMYGSQCADLVNHLSQKFQAVGYIVTQLLRHQLTLVVQ